MRTSENRVTKPNPIATWLTIDGIVFLKNNGIVPVESLRRYDRRLILKGRTWDAVVFC